MDMRVIYRTCPTCGSWFDQPDDPGRKRRFSPDACSRPHARLSVTKGSAAAA
jgi:hypothetical protein